MSKCRARTSGQCRGKSLPVPGRFWIYVPDTAGPAARSKICPARCRFPLLQSYIDVVLEGGLEYGQDFAREIIDDRPAIGAGFWLNDRRLARRPWVFDSHYSAVDRLLSLVYAPHLQTACSPRTMSRGSCLMRNTGLRHRRNDAVADACRNRPLSNVIGPAVHDAGCDRKRSHHAGMLLIHSDEAAMQSAPADALPGCTPPTWPIPRPCFRRVLW